MWVGLHKTKREIASGWSIASSANRRKQVWHSNTFILTMVLKCVQMKSVSFLTHQGTIHTTSTSTHLNTTHSSNGATELSSKWCVHNIIMLDSYLGLFGENAKACNHILDRSLNSHHPSLTPNEHYNDRKPDSSYIHVWGCDAHYKLQKRERNNKLSEKAKSVYSSGMMITMTLTIEF